MSLLKSFRSQPRSNGQVTPDDSVAQRESQPHKPVPKKLLARDRIEARHQEDDVGLWRDYHAFLTARQTLLAVRAAEARAAFEQADTLEADARAAQGRLDAIPAPTRAMFEHVLEDRPALEWGKELAATEPRPGTGGEHDGRDAGPVRPGASHVPMLAHPSTRCLALGPGWPSPGRYVSPPATMSHRATRRERTSVPDRPCDTESVRRVSDHAHSLSCGRPRRLWRPWRHSKAHLRVSSSHRDDR